MHKMFGWNLVAEKRQYETGFHQYKERKCRLNRNRSMWCPTLGLYKNVISPYRPTD